MSMHKGSLPWLLGGAALVLACLAPGSGAATDLHKLWDGKCGGCHGHAGAFARKHLTVADGRLVGRSHPDVAAFLGTHNGGYSPQDIEAIAAMLREQALTPDLFARKCRSCHGTAVQLARDDLVRRGGELYGRRSQRRIADFLTGHAGMDSGEAATMLKVLSRVETEVHRP